MYASRTGMAQSSVDALTELTARLTTATTVDDKVRQ